MTITERKLAIALDDLRKARSLARGAGAPYAALAIQRAIKSTEGAKNHARGRGDRKHRPRRVARPRTPINALTVAALTQAIRDSQTIRAIVAVLDGTSWSPETLDEIADILRDAGHEIADVDDDDSNEGEPEL